MQSPVRMIVAALAAVAVTASGATTLADAAAPAPYRKAVQKSSPNRKAIAKASPNRKAIAKSSPNRKAVQKSHVIVGKPVK